MNIYSLCPVFKLILKQLTEISLWLRLACDWDYPRLESLNIKLATVTEDSEDEDDDEELLTGDDSLSTMREVEKKETAFK